MISSDEGTQRFQYIDTLRGLAALSVITHHLMQTAAAAYPPEAALGSPDLGAFGDLGQTGVIVFFLISGFVIPFSFKAKRPLRSFAVGRFFRLFPAYWVSVVFAVAVLWWLGNDAMTTGQVLANLTMIQKAFSQPSLSGSYWTLFLELQFYALCAAACSCKYVQSPVYLCAVVVILALVAAGGAIESVHNPYAMIPSTKLMFLAVMHLGALVRLARVERSEAAGRLLPIAMALMVVVFPAVAGLTPFLPTRMDWRSEVMSFYVGLIVFIAVVETESSCRVLKFCGTISYGLYLFHATVMRLAISVAGMCATPCSRFVFVVLSLSATFAVAILVHAVVERPSNQMARRILDR